MSIKRVSAILLAGSTLLALGWLTYVGAAAPKAEFSFSPSNPDINTEVAFDASNSFSSGTQISQYAWDFDSNGEYDAITDAPKISHLFDKSGTSSVKLRITDQRGAQEIITQSISVRSASVRIRREITTPLDADRVTSGSAFQVKITATFLETVTAPGIDEDFPANWRISPVSHGDALYKGSETAWLMTSIADPGTIWEILYNVTVPSGTASGIYEIEGKLTSRSVSNPITIAIPGDHSVRVI